MLVIYKIGHFRAVVLHTGRTFLCSKNCIVCRPTISPRTEFPWYFDYEETLLPVPIKFTLGLHGLGPSARL